MNCRTLCILLALIICQLINAQAQIVHHDTKITVKVVDEDRQPVSNALVTIVFGRDRELGKAVQIEGMSDSSGLFAAQHESDGQVFWGVQKPGFYSSTGYEHLFKRDLIEAGRWQPWDKVFNVIVRKINNPVPVFRKYVNQSVPEMSQPVGYDLMVGDWVTPHGQGKSPDLIFLTEYNQRSVKDYDFRLKVYFSRPGDGIQEITNGSELAKSDFKWPYLAPDGGYMKDWVQTRSRTPAGGERGNRNPDRKYALRIRSVVDDAGNIVNALYGRISGDFMDFTYCVNPTENDRNLEYSGENLFEGDGPISSP